MAKFTVKYIYSDGSEFIDEDEVFDTYEEADEAGRYGVACFAEGNETLHMSNPGDYPLDEEGSDYEVVEVYE